MITLPFLLSFLCFKNLTCSCLLISFALWKVWFTCKFMGLHYIVTQNSHINFCDWIWIMVSLSMIYLSLSRLLLSYCWVLKALGLWVFSLIKCLIFTFPSDVGLVLTLDIPIISLSSETPSILMGMLPLKWKLLSIHKNLHRRCCTQ